MTRSLSYSSSRGLFSLEIRSNFCLLMMVGVHPVSISQWTDSSSTRPSRKNPFGSAFLTVRASPRLTGAAFSSLKVLVKDNLLKSVLDS